MYELLPGRACTAYIGVLERMIGEGLFKRDAAPQLEDISQFLKSEQDFTVILTPTQTIQVTYVYVQVVPSKVSNDGMQLAVVMARLLFQRRRGSPFVRRRDW